MPHNRKLIKYIWYMYTLAHRCLTAGNALSKIMLHRESRDTNDSIISFSFQIKICMHRRKSGRTQTKMLTVVLTRWQNLFSLSAFCKICEVTMCYLYVKDFCNIKTNLWEKKECIREHMYASMGTSMHVDHFVIKWYLIIVHMLFMYK